MSKFTVKRTGDPATRKLTVAEVKRIAQSYYNVGGDMIIECWDDHDIRNWIATTPGTLEALMREMRLANIVRCDMEATVW